jgi:hypothetical protein
MRSPVAFDMEVYQNYTLLLFKDVATKTVTRFELPLDDLDLEILTDIITTNRLITFNGNGYDIPLLMLVLRGDDSLKIKKASDRIIVQNLKPWNFEKEFNVKLNPPELDHVDLMEVAPLTGSLKLYGGRLHSRSLQDLPIAPGKVVSEDDKTVLRLYCENDCDTLIDLYNALKVQSELREQMSRVYGIDLRSKSDAQIAEAVIKKEVETILRHRLEKPGHSSGDRFHYQIPLWVTYKTVDILPAIRDAYFIVSDKGGVLIPDELKTREITLSKGVYRMGIGGLHSSETKQIVKEDREHMLMDFDVVSYYPSILLNQGLYPKHIGPEFLTVYKKLVAQRLAAKAAGNKAVSESLKITINGTFGKLSSKWSALYSPDLFIQIVITGQLALLMLIEALDDILGVEVMSANTDGVTIRCRRDTEKEALDAVKTWEQTTGFETERADYAALYSRDVNNYIAVKTSGEVKTKGAYGIGLPLHKNPYAQICSRSVIDYLTLDASIEGTVAACRDIRQFVCIRTVKGGAIHHGKPIGKIIRWYYSTLEEEAILYQVNNYLVPNTYGAAPAVVLPTEIPVDLDRAWYVKEAYSLLTDLGVAA